MCANPAAASPVAAVVAVADDTLEIASMSSCTRPSGRSFGENRCFFEEGAAKRTRGGSMG